METGDPAGHSIQSIDTATPQQQSLTPVLVQLLKGVVYQDTHTHLWQQLFDLESPVRDQLNVLGLELYLDEEEGFAFVKQKIAEPGEAEIPRLVVRRALSYPVSLLCVLLRKRMAEADHRGGDLKLVISRQDLHNDMQVFFTGQSNEARLADQLDSHIEKVIKMGFLKRLKEKDHFEVRRIIKALVDGDWLADLEEKLRVYKDHADE